MASRPETSPEAFLASALDPPPSAAVRAAIARLRSIGAVVNAASTDDALSDNTNSLTLTPLGFHLSHLPVEPRLGKMLVYAVALGCLPAVLTAAAALTARVLWTAVTWWRRGRGSRRWTLHAGFGGGDAPGAKRNSPFVASWNSRSVGIRIDFPYGVW